MTDELTNILKEGIKQSKETIALIENESKRLNSLKQGETKQCDIHVVGISEVIKAATNWFAIKEYNKHFNDLTRQEQNKVNKEFKIINDYLKSIH